MRNEPTYDTGTMQGGQWAAADAAVDVEPSGWRVFAAVMILIGGLFNVFDGLVAALDTRYYLRIVQTRNGPQLVISNDLHGWGWFAFGVGLVMCAAAVFILAGERWARWVGAVIAGLDMIFQLAFLPVYPFWAIIMIGVDALVIYGLLARSSRR